MTVAVTGLGLALAGVQRPADLLGARPADPVPVDPRERLGRKGLRYKDRATQLALCAAQEALAESGMLVDGEPAVPGDEVAVVVSSNLGNVDTVCRVAATIGEQTSTGVSPMDIPNASSNIIASELAIKFRLRGPNLTVCSGPTSGLDAVRWARVLLRGGRARQVLVVGVEPDNDIVREATGAGRVLDGAVALVLEDEEAARLRGIAGLLRLGMAARSASAADCLRELGADTGAWMLPEDVLPEDRDLQLPDGATGYDLGSVWGHGSGALGVLQVAAAVGWFGSGRTTPVHAVTGGTAGDPAAGIGLLPPHRTERAGR